MLSLVFQTVEVVVISFESWELPVMFPWECTFGIFSLREGPSLDTYTVTCLLVSHWEEHTINKSVWFSGDKQRYSPGELGLLFGIFCYYYCSLLLAVYNKEPRKRIIAHFCGLRLFRIWICKFQWLRVSMLCPWRSPSKEGATFCLNVSLLPGKTLNGYTC